MNIKSRSRWALRFVERPDYELVYSQLEGVRGHVAPHWRAELFDHSGGDGWMARPVAIAYVTEYPIDILGPMLDYISAHPPRSPDAAPYLVARLLERWPDLHFTDRINSNGTFRGEGA